MTDVPAWRLEPLGRIGSLDDPEESLTRIGQVLIAPDQSLYVSQPSDDWISVFDAEDRFVRRVGRSGDGPGEFGFVRAIGLKADTLYVSDSGHDRVSYFGPDGNLVRSDRWVALGVLGGSELNAAPGVPILVGSVPGLLLSDGSALMEPLLLIMAGSGDETGTTTGIRPDPVLRVSLDGAIIDTVVWGAHESTTVGIPTEGTVFRTACLFGRAPLIELMRDGSGVVKVDRPEPVDEELPGVRVTLIGPSGDTTTARTLVYDPVPLPPDMVRDTIESIRRRYIDRDRPVPAAAAIEKAFRDAECVPSTLPTVTRVVPTQDGRIWLRREAVPGAPVRWTVLEGDGDPVGEVEIPFGQDVVAADAETVVTTFQDELDVPYLVRYRLHR